MGNFTSPVPLFGKEEESLPFVKGGKEGFSLPCLQNYGLSTNSIIDQSITFLKLIQDSLIPLYLKTSELLSLLLSYIHLSAGLSLSLQRYNVALRQSR